MALRVWGRVTEQEFVRRIRARVGDGKRKSERVRVIFDRVHEPSGAGVDLKGSLAFVTGEEGFDSVAFLTVDPFCLGERGGGGGIAAFEEVAVGVAGVGTSDDFGMAFDFGGHGELDVDKFEVFDVDKAGVVVEELDVVLEVGGACTGEG